MSLTDFKIKSAKPKEKQYKLSDSDGLFLLISPNGSKYWRMRYYLDKKEYLLSLGTYPLITLSEARENRDKYRKLVAQGINPAEEKKQVGVSQDNTFEAIARIWCARQAKWTEHHRHRVLRTLEINLFPVIGSTVVPSLTTKDLLAPIKNVEKQGKTELASRLQQRINSIMRYAVQQGIVNYNPAQELAGCVMKDKVTHRPAIELERLPELLNRIESYQGRLLTKLAIELTLLIFIRSSELRFARWSEIDFDKKIWTIPAEREPIEGVKFSYRGSKMRTPHLAPLSEQAINILKQIHEISGQYELIFIGDHNPYNVMSESTVNSALRKMGYDTKTEQCCHGFRTIACSALVESSLWSRDAIEKQMSHQERNGVRAAYIHKAEHINERFKIVQWWADYLDLVKDGFVMPYEANQMMRS